MHSKDVSLILATGGEGMSMSKSVALASVKSTTIWKQSFMNLLLRAE